MRVLVIFLVMLLFLPLASAAQLTFVGDESLKELPGSGTPGDPYLLGNLFINATNDTAILIKNTSAFLLIKNVSIVGENKRPGIILENVKNVRIENIRIVRCSYGIKIINSENITIANSTFKGNLYCYWKSKFAGDADCKGGAIFADYSRNLHIINNSFVPHSYLFSNIYGVYLIMVKNSTIYGNRFVSSVKCFPSAAFGGYCKGAAVYLDRSSGNEIIRNTIP
ncbi:right-handed parallel beta-helix repeat-containing protein [Thermococcus litoralis]|uniref:right-handed parallel beta-helix repeat-containing protein n=1 Tax=Thermococcus litoralis TaxID=2265 RepID=UPI000B3515EC|nr:right-handed parallel beta-helix repeat-containing protein [Thermococcus litoralis]